MYADDNKMNASRACRGKLTMALLYRVGLMLVQFPYSMDRALHGPTGSKSWQQLLGDWVILE
jgi:hypothetical protein